METEALLILIHILLFAYWLGSDIGVFYSSGFVVDGSLSRERRIMAGKIMHTLDLVPRICMTMVLTVGGLLATFTGVQHPAWMTAGLLLLAPFWLTLVLYLHFGALAQLDWIRKVDIALRWLLVLGIPVSTGYAWFYRDLAAYPWLAAKLLGFALLIFCGLAIRFGIGGYVQGYMALAVSEPSDEENERMRASLARVRPWVVFIWIVLVFEAWLGIAKPG